MQSSTELTTSPQSPGSSPSLSADQCSSSESNSFQVRREEEEDFLLDNVASPIDLESRIQADRIEKILTETLWKTKLSIALPLLVHDLHGILSEAHYRDLIYIFEEYDRPRFSSISIDHLERPRSVSMVKTREYAVLGHLIYIIDSYKQLKPMVEEVISKMRENYLKEKPEIRKINPALEYLLTLEQFKVIIMKRVRQTAEQELVKKLTTRKNEKSNDQLITLNKELENTIKLEKEEFMKNMSEKVAALEDLRLQVENVDSVLADRLRRQVLDSEREMVMHAKAHKVRLEILKEHDNEVKESYQNILSRSLEEEKTHRARKLKVEKQLESWIQKYDVEMTDKQKELDEFIDLCEKENKKVTELEEHLEEQNKLYIPLMVEKDQEYNLEMAKKVMAFQIDHAARVIQSAWRQVLANRLEKKKLKNQLDMRKKAEEKQKLKEIKEAKKAEKAAKLAAKLAKKTQKA